MLEKVKVAVAQVAPVFMDKEATIDKACRAMEEAGRNDAELIVFSETFIPGYPYWRGTNPISRWSENQIEYMKNAISVPSQDTEILGDSAKDAEATHCTTLFCSSLRMDSYLANIVSLCQHTVNEQSGTMGTAET